MWPADLRALAKQRDAFPPVADTLLAKEGLEQWYAAVYKQFSSVSHYDRFSVEMVKPYEYPDGTVSFALAPYWFGSLIFYTGLLDMIQCLEAVKVSLGQDVSADFERLFGEWRDLSRHIQAS